MTTQLFHDPFSKGRPSGDARQTATRILSGHHLSVLSTTNQDGREVVGGTATARIDP